MATPARGLHDLANLISLAQIGELARRLQCPRPFLKWTFNLAQLLSEGSSILCTVNSLTIEIQHSDAVVTREGGYQQQLSPAFILDFHVSSYQNNCQSNCLKKLPASVCKDDT